MAALTFDTLKFVETLRMADFSEKQAKALSDALKEAQESRLEDLATKRDLKELELKIAETEARLIKWVVGTAGVVVAMTRLIP